jgi:hypothetical protein
MASPSVTYTFTNGTTADASQVNQNFSDLISAMTDGSKSFSIDALTCAGVFTANGNSVIGNASSDTCSITATTTFNTTPLTDTITEKTGDNGVQIKGRKSGTAISAGYIGEVITSAGNTGGTAIGAADTFVNITSLSLTKGMWLIGANAMFNTNAAEDGIMDLAISAYSANTTTDHVEGDNVLRQWGRDSTTGYGGNYFSITVANLPKVLSADTTIYLKTKGKNANNRYHGYRISATRIG